MQELITLGYASQALQQSPARLRIALDDAGSKPQLSLNGQFYYAFDDVVRAVARIEEHLGSKASG